MPANTSPIFALVPELSSATVTLATTDRTGATMGNTAILLTAGANGAKITQFIAKAAGSNPSTIILIFVSDSTGANFKLFDELGVAAVNATALVTAQRAVNTYTDLQLKAGQVVRVGTTIAVTDGINVFAAKGDY
jgi:hypothetical protein